MDYIVAVILILAAGYLVRRRLRGVSAAGQGGCGCGCQGCGSGCETGACGGSRTPSDPATGPGAEMQPAAKPAGIKGTRPDGGV